MPDRVMTLQRIVAKDEHLRIFLGKIWQEAGELQWAQSGKTRQGHEHCEQVESNVYRLFADTGLLSLCTPTVGFILSAAAALHDIGKIERSKTEPVDPDHGLEGKKRILKLPHNLFPDPESRHIIADVVGLHANGPFKEVTAAERRCLGFDVWPRSLAAVFRLADMLEATSDRAPESYCVFRGNLFQKHRDVWLARQAVTGWKITDDRSRVVLQARPETPEAARAVVKLVRLTNQDLHRHHKEALRNLRFARPPDSRHSRRKPETLQLPTTIVLNREDSRVVKQMARKETHGYFVRDHEVQIRFEPARAHVRERLDLTIVEPRSAVNVGLAAEPYAMNDVVWDNKRIAPADYKVVGAALQVMRSTTQDDQPKLECEYGIETTLIELTSGDAPHQSGFTVLFEGAAELVDKVSALDVNPDGTRTPSSATQDRRESPLGALREFRLERPDPHRAFQFSW